MKKSIKKNKKQNPPSMYSARKRFKKLVAMHWAYWLFTKIYSKTYEDSHSVIHTLLKDGFVVE